MRWVCSPILLVFCWIQQAEPVWCYVCTSAELECCGYPFNYTECKDHLAFCDPVRNSGRKFFCSTKMFSKTHFNKVPDRSKDLYVRKCLTDRNLNFSPGTCPGFRIRDVRPGVTQVVCTVCDTDGCNAASRNAYSSLKYLLYASVLFLAIK